jgi:cyclopropane fatty-acyl-phospholipid synthase-like methyltransferase
MPTAFRRLTRAFFVTLTLLAASSSLAVAQSPRSAPENEKIFEALKLEPGAVVGEIGAGNGELSIAAARVVGTQGKVFTSELGDNRVKSLETAVQSSGLSQITVVTGDANKTNFPDACCNAIFMRNVYHHFADPIAMTKSIAASLKPGGRVAIVDFMPNRNRPEAARPADRANNDSHGVSADSVSRELKEAGLDIVTSQPGNDRWFMVVAVKPR